MRRVLNTVAIAIILLIPRMALAQATIAGVVRDASSAVLPGVRVEVSSPVLIDKTRTVTTDTTGQYRITDLPPGSYSMTFSLGGFSSVTQEGLVVSGSGVIPVNAQLRMGTLQETVTVTAHSPIVDTQSTRREVVLSAQTINTLAATRGYNVFNANFATADEQTYEYRTNGAAWLQPTSIAAPRLARLHVTLSF